MALGYANNNPYGVVDLIGRNYFQGSPKFGLYSGNPVKPNTNGMIFKTDENGNPTPLTADEMELLKQKSASTSREAAIEAASPSPVSQKNSPWYDFLKHPKNTPYEQEQMRNQGILRDAAIAAAMNKPVFFPEADTLSEPMAKLANQQAGLAQSAMGQLTARQGMSGDAYKQATNLATQYASNALQADIQAKKLKADSDEALRNSKIYAKMGESLYGQLPDDVKAISDRPDFIEVVQSKFDEKTQNLAKEYDAIKRYQAALQNDAQSKYEQSMAYNAKSKAFLDGASRVSKEWELGMDFGDGGVEAKPFEGEDIRLAKQGDIGVNGAGSFGNFANPKNNVPETPVQNTPSAPAEVKTGSAKGNLTFNNGKVGKVPTPKSDSDYEKGSPEYDFEKLANEYFKIGKFGKSGAWVHPDTQMQRRALDDNWLRNVNGVMQKLALDLRNRPESFANHRKLFDYLRSGNQFGDTSKILEAAANPPMSYNLSYYLNQFNTTGDETERADLQTYLGILGDGGALTMAEVNHLQKLLSERFPVENLKGEKKPLLQQNGLKIKFSKATNPDGSPMMEGKEQLYFVPMDDSFK